MTGIRGLLALLGLIASVAELRAQVVIVPNPYLGGSNLLYAHPGRRSSLVVYYGYTTPYYRSGGINQVTLVVPSPQPQPQITVVGVAPRILRLDDLAVLDPELHANPPPPDKPPEPRLPGGRDAGVFRPLAPDNRDRAARPLPPPPEPKRAPPLPPGDLPRPVPADADPRAEGARQLKLGREAYADREYGRAIQRFREAARRTPDNAEPYFLLGQALFAAGRYPEAVEAIRAGVGLRPDWPKVHFMPRDLYGPNAADFVDHLRRVQETLLLLPDDPVLLFLYGYELWFDGRQDEARPLFRRARIVVVDPAVIDRFLAVRPAL